VVFWCHAFERPTARSAPVYRGVRSGLKSRTVGGGSYGVAMETTEDTTPLSTEDYWARMQALRDQLAELQQSAPAC
jgi:hypothetical protein